MTAEPDRERTRRRSAAGSQQRSYTVIAKDAGEITRNAGTVTVRHVDVYPSAEAPARAAGTSESPAEDALTDAVEGLLILGARGDDLAELADHLSPNEIPAPAVLLQARRNAEWRAGIAETYGLLTAAEVADVLGSTASNRAAVASRLAKDEKILAVRYKGGRIVYPGFQFTSNGDVHDAIEPILDILGDAGFGGWELVSWFTAANERLDGAAPVDRLDDREAVLAAARDEVEPVGF